MRLGGEAIKAAFAEHGPWVAWRNDQAIRETDLHIGSNSVDVTLDNQFITLYIPYERNYVNVLDSSTVRTKNLTSEALIIFPGDFILGCTRERFQCSAKFEERYWCQQLDGRSTIGRLGIGIHVTAGFGDYGFAGRFTLEMFNCGTVAVQLHAGMRIGQVSFEEVLKPILYKGAYSCSDHMHKPIGPVVGKTRM